MIIILHRVSAVTESNCRKWYCTCTGLAEIHQRLWCWLVSSQGREHLDRALSDVPCLLLRPARDKQHLSIIMQLCWPVIPKKPDTKM